MHAHVADHGLLNDHFLHGMKDVLRRRAADEFAVDVAPGLIDRLARRRLSDSDCRQLIAEMDAAGIAQTVLLIADFGFGHEDAEASLTRLYDQHRALLAAHPDRLIVFGGADPRRGPAGLALFERGLSELGFRGLKLYPPCGYEIDDPGLSPYYELCAAHGAPVLIHTGPSLSTMTGDRGYPASILRTAERFPRVQFVLGHAAYQSFDTNVAIAERHRNVYLETSGFQRLIDRRDELLALTRALFARIPDQVVFGTDWPVFNIKAKQADWVRYFAELDVLDDGQRARLFHRNAEAALGPWLNRAR